MPRTPEQMQLDDWEAVRRNLAEAMAEAEDWSAEFAPEMRMEAERLSKKIEKRTDRQRTDAT